MNETPDRRLRVGDWCVDPVAGEIRRGDEAARVEARTLRLLLRLAESPGEVVSLDTLLDDVWAGVTVTQDSVYQAVAALRRVMGDDPRRPRYIATAPRLGYRLVAAVGPWDAPAAAPAALAEAPTPSRRPWLVAAAGTAVLVAAGLVFAMTRPPPQPPATVAVLPFADMTPSMDQEVLADNLTEDVIDAVAREPGLRTPPPRAAFALKGRELDPAQAAKALGVAWVIDGSVRVAGPKVRVTARLVRADTGFVAWSRSYDAASADLAPVQAAIADGAAATIRQAR